MTIKLICFLSIFLFILACSIKQPDLKMNEVSINNIYSFEDYIIVKKKQLQPDWYYVITKRWIE